MSAFILGVGMTPFRKPSASPDYQELGTAAARAALADAGIRYEDVEQVYAGYVYGDSTAGQSVAYGLGLTGVPVINVNNNCSTGSTALFLARQMVESGAADCVLAIGFEQMRRGALTDIYEDRPSPLGRFNKALEDAGEPEGGPMAARFFAGAGAEHARLYGTRPETFAAISVKARRHAEHNPNALFREPVTVEEVMASGPVHRTTTRLQCCPPTCGGAAAVVVSEQFLARRGSRTGAVKIAAQVMTTDRASTFEGSLMRLVGYDMAREGAMRVYEAAGIGPDDVDVVEMHDCFAPNELISYEALGLAPEGGAEKFILDGDNTYGGKVVTNPSGGLLSKGHPLGATGLAQCAELVWQLRGAAGVRQVEDARIALQHNLGLGGACVVTLYERDGTA